jgi:hypothetical protein
MGHRIGGPTSRSLSLMLEASDMHGGRACVTGRMRDAAVVEPKKKKRKKKKAEKKK